MEAMLPRYVRSIAEVFLSYDQDYDQLFHLVKLLEYLLRSITPIEFRDESLFELVRRHQDKFRSPEEIVGARWRRNDTTHPEVFECAEDLAKEITQHQIVEQMPVVIRAIVDILPFCSQELQELVKQTREQTLPQRPTLQAAPATSLFPREAAEPRKMNSRQRIQLLREHARQTGGLISDGD